MTQTVYFIGVSTAGSRIHTLFPRWMALLGIDAELQGVDLPLGTDRDRYHAVVERIARDDQVAGAVITTHKLGVYDAAHDLFDATDRFVALCREVSAIAKRDHRLIAHAPDPLAAGATLQTILGPAYWLDTQADVLCLGAGGAATAIALCLLAQPDALSTAVRPSSIPPRRTIFVDIDPSRLEGLRRVVNTVNPRAHVEYLCHSSATDNDDVLGTLSPGSLIINATGMGKDPPGSPLTNRAVFPVRSVVWDLNYRGALTFLLQARAQHERQELQVHDGWLYFLHGWAQALSPILGVNLAPAVFHDGIEVPRESNPFQSPS